MQEIINNGSMSSVSISIATMLSVSNGRIATEGIRGHGCGGSNIKCSSSGACFVGRIPGALGTFGRCFRVSVGLLGVYDDPKTFLGRGATSVEDCLFKLIRGIGSLSITGRGTRLSTVANLLRGCSTSRLATVGGTAGSGVRGSLPVVSKRVGRGRHSVRLGSSISITRLRLLGGALSRRLTYGVGGRASTRTLRGSVRGGTSKVLRLGFGLDKLRARTGSTGLGGVQRIRRGVGSTGTFMSSVRRRVEGGKITISQVGSRVDRGSSTERLLTGG